MGPVHADEGVFAAHRITLLSSTGGTSVTDVRGHRIQVKRGRTARDSILCSSSRSARDTVILEQTGASKYPDSRAVI